MARTIDQLILLSVPEIQQIFLAIMQSMVNEAMLEEMIKAIEANDVEALYKASGFSPAVLGPILDAIDSVFKQSAEITVSGWPKRIMTPDGPVKFYFDMRNPATEQILRSKAGEFISRISNEVLDNVRLTLEQGMIRGQNPRAIALDIVGRKPIGSTNRTGGVIGLATNQVNWVNSARTYLEQLNPKYLEMGLRDKRFDSVVRRAIETKTNLDKETINKLLTAYKSSALRYRGENIARTEVIQSINRGEREAHDQAIRQGVLSRQQITKEWDDVGDSRVRSSHRVMAEKYGKGKGIAFDEAFVSPAGARLLYPGDTSLGAPAQEIISCRCRQHIRVNWFYAEVV